MQTLCWSKSSPSFSSAHSSCISRSINNIFVPQIGMYIRFNMSKTDFIYLKMWCDSVTFCQRGHFFLTHPVVSKTRLLGRPQPQIYFPPPPPPKPGNILYFTPPPLRSHGNLYYQQMGGGGARAVEPRDIPPPPPEIYILYSHIMISEMENAHIIY